MFLRSSANARFSSAAVYFTLVRPFLGTCFTGVCFPCFLPAVLDGEVDRDRPDTTDFDGGFDRLLFAAGFAGLLANLPKASRKTFTNFVAALEVDRI